MQNKSYKYENIQIGNFLVSIGYYLSEFNYKLPAAINLHQQTPNDYTIGDLFGAFDGKFFIIEFKNNENNLINELSKKQRQKLIDNLNHDFSRLKNPSIKGHFICYPNFIEVEMKYNLRPYLSINSEKLAHYKIINVDEFLKTLLEDDKIGMTFQEIKNYIALLQKCAIEEGNKSSSGVSSGILMNFDKNKGVKYYSYDDLDFLNRMVIQEKEILPKLGNNPIKNKSKGLGMGL